MNEQGQNLFELDILIYDIYSPNIEDSEIIVNLNLGKILMLYEPNTLNETVKFFRNTKSQTLKDIESFQMALMHDEVNSTDLEF